MASLVHSDWWTRWLSRPETASGIASGIHSQQRVSEEMPETAAVVLAASHVRRARALAPIAIYYFPCKAFRLAISASFCAAWRYARDI